MTIAKLKKRLDYPLRQFFRWRRPGLRFVNESKDDIFFGFDKKVTKENRRIAKRLLDKYNLENLYKNSQKRKYCENLYYLELLEK
ncbi:MAG: hypothetical protein MUO76_22150, partial [Anaerolineaceae bacterium]|nr:hypothetical protein [Anaerolineaceae bacterium]